MATALGTLRLRRRRDAVRVQQTMRLDRQFQQFLDILWSKAQLGPDPLQSPQSGGMQKSQRIRANEHDVSMLLEEGSEGPPRRSHQGAEQGSRQQGAVRRQQGPDLLAQALVLIEVLLQVGLRELLRRGMVRQIQGGVIEARAGPGRMTQRAGDSGQPPLVPGFVRALLPLTVPPLQMEEARHGLSTRRKGPRAGGTAEWVPPGRSG